MYIDKVVFEGCLDRCSYLNELPAVRFLAEHGELSLKNNVTFFVGENGAGKSTLLEAIAAAYGFNPEGGSQNFSFSTNNTHSTLHNQLRIVRSKFSDDGFFLRAESFYNIASYIDEIYDGEAGSIYGGKSLHKQSHGESFLSLIKHRFKGKGLYMLDEPESALSPSHQLSLLAHINHLVKNDSQFIIATHSPILMAFPNAKIYMLSDIGIESVNYQDTEHYQLTKYFLNNPEGVLRNLFSK